MKRMKAVTMKKTDNTIRGTAPKVGKGHAFGAAGAGRNTLFIARKSRRNEKQRMMKGE